MIFTDFFSLNDSMILLFLPYTPSSLCWNCCVIMEFTHGDWAKKENKEILKNKIERLSVQYVSSLNTMFLFIGSVTWNFLVVIMEWSNLGVSGTFNLTYPWFYIARWDYTPSFVLPIATLFLRWILMLRENKVFYGH